MRDFSPHILSIVPACFLASVATAVIGLGSPDIAQAQMPGEPPEIYAKACARCHAADGSGTVSEPTVTTQSLDFTDCAVAAREPDSDWWLAIAEGGLAVGLSPEMPSFADVLSNQQIDGLVAHLRGFCKDPRWPHGNLNFPRPLLTEKAYPEDEFLIVPTVSHRDDRRHNVTVTAILEKRIGHRGQFELSVPVGSVDFQGKRQSGIGDVTFATKYVLHADRRGTRILSAGLELETPTGDQERGLGEQSAVFEPFVAAGTVVGPTCFQVHLKLELPTNAPWTRKEFVYNVWAGWDLSRYLNTWTIGLELGGAQDAFALTPQLRKGLTRTGALAAAGGVRLPLNKRDEQDVRWLGYLLWEYLEPVRARR